MNNQPNLQKFCNVFEESNIPMYDCIPFSSSYSVVHTHTQHVYM